MASPAPSPAPAKVCIQCNTDCSTRPRTKDDLGRYTCKACYDKLSQEATRPAPKPPAEVAKAVRSAKPAPKSDAPEVEALPTFLFDEKPVVAAPDQEMCQNCGKLMKKAAAVCIHCGHNKLSGKTVQTVLKRPEIISEKASATFDLDSWPVWGTMCLASVTICILMIASGDNSDMADLHLWANRAAWIYFGITGLATVAAMFMGGLWHGIFGILALGIPAFTALQDGTIRYGVYKFVSLGYILYWTLLESGSRTIKVAYISGLSTIIISIIYLQRAQ